MAGKKTGNPQKVTVSFRVHPDLDKTFKDLENIQPGIKRSALMAYCLEVGIKEYLKKESGLETKLKEYQRRHDHSDFRKASNEKPRGG